MPKDNFLWWGEMSVNDQLWTEESNSSVMAEICTIHLWRWNTSETRYKLSRTDRVRQVLVTCQRLWRKGWIGVKIYATVEICQKNMLLFLNDLRTLQPICREYLINESSYTGDFFGLLRRGLLLSDKTEETHMWIKAQMSNDMEYNVRVRVERSQSGSISIKMES